MITLIDLDKNDLSNIYEMLSIRGSSHLSIITAATYLVFSASNTEFSKTYVKKMSSEVTGGARLNYRIPTEIAKLMFNSQLVGGKGGNQGLYLVLEEAKSLDAEDLVLISYIKCLTAEEKEALLTARDFDLRTVSVATSKLFSCNVFTTVIAKDYDFKTKLEWVASYLSGKTKKHALDARGSLKYLVDVSKIFKTGIYIKNNLAYTNSSKTGIEIYRYVKFPGDPMLIGHECVSALYDFSKYVDGSLSIFRCNDWMIAATSGGLLFSWKNLRFDLDPNIEDLQAAKYLSVYECPLKDVSRIFSGVTVTKANRITFNLNFIDGAITLTDPMKGTYRFSVPFQSLRGNYPEEDKKVKLNFKMLRTVLSMKSEYNMVRFLVYKRFIRIDLINLYGEDDEDEEPFYDSENKITLIVGRAE